MNNTEQTELQKKADEMLTFFVWDKRDNGKEFVKLTDNAPESLKDLVREAHDSMSPDDYKYEFVFQALNLLVENEDPDDAQVEPDIYNYDLAEWLGSHVERSEYVNEAVQEWGVSATSFDIYQVIGLGQLREREEVFHIVRSELEDIIEVA